METHAGAVVTLPTDAGAPARASHLDAQGDGMQPAADGDADDEELCIGSLAFDSDSDDPSEADDGCRGSSEGLVARHVDDALDDDETADALLTRLRTLPSRAAPPPPPLPEQVLQSALDPTYRVERIACADLPVAAFRRRTAPGGAAALCPLIIEGVPVVDDGIAAGLVADVVRAAIPDDLAIPVRGHGTWPAAKFFEALARDDRVYLADASFTRHFPWMHRLVRVPAYFLHDFSHRTRRALSVAHDTPALFVGGGGTRSPLHIDQMRSNFWMYLGEGYKHWTTFHPDDVAHLAPAWDDAEQIERFPALDALDAAAVARARRLDFTLRPGDTLFIPRGTPHEVVNLCATTAISANYVDQTNVLETVAQTRARLARCAAGSARAANLREIADGLDEIDWPDVEDDVGAPPSASRAEDALVGRFALHERSMTIDPVKLGAAPVS